MTSPARASAQWCLLLAAILSLGLAACDKGPFSPEARLQTESLAQYMLELRSALTTNETFEWNTLSSALTVRALPYSPAVALAAERRFAGDPVFLRETESWTGAARGRARPPVVVLMGLYTPDLSEKDVTRLARFRPRLRSDDGRLWPPREIKRYGRDDVFVRDHFPVFNPWEEVYRLTFDAPAGRYPYSGALNFVLEWPGGTQSLILKR